MDLFETIRTRRTIRQYTGGKISDTDLEIIVDAGRLAASGNNRQPWEFVVITDPMILQQLRIPDDHWLCRAAAVIAIIMDPESRWWVEDGAAAAQNMLLTCTALGYGACWMEGYSLRNQERIRAALDIPNHLRLFTLIAVGIPDEQPVKEKKPLESVLHWQKYKTYEKE